MIRDENLSKICDTMWEKAQAMLERDGAVAAKAYVFDLDENNGKIGCSEVIDVVTCDAPEACLSPRFWKAALPDPTVNGYAAVVIGSISLLPEKYSAELDALDAADEEGILDDDLQEHMSQHGVCQLMQMVVMVSGAALIRRANLEDVGGIRVLKSGPGSEIVPFVRLEALEAM